MMQGILSFVAFVFNPVQLFLCELLKNIMAADAVEYWKNYRLYGLSCSLSYGMPIAQSLIGGMALIYAKKYNNKYFFFVPILWGSAIINARVTMVVVIIELFLIFFAHLRYKPSFKIKRESIFIFLFLLFIILIVLSDIVRKGVNLSRITDPIIEFLALLQGKRVFKTEGYFAYLFFDPKAFAFPAKEKMLLGGGIWNSVSDIGYIHNLWVGGIVYSLLLYLFYFGLLKRWYRELKNSGEINRIIPIMFGVVLFIVNIKGDAFGSISEFINLFYLMLGISLFIRKKENQNMEEKETY